MRIDQLEEMAVLMNQPENQPGTVVMLANEAARYTLFWLNLMGLQIPAGSVVKPKIGSDISELRNQACAEIHGEWIWFIDDDHSFRPDILVQLLTRNVDIAAPLCLRRQQPFLPVPTVDDNFMDLSLYGPDELVEVQFSGSSGMLIRRSVIETIDPPWFELGRDSQGRRISEDVNFCIRATEAGFKIHVDTAARLGHLVGTTVWPSWSEKEDRWMTGLTIADGFQVAIETAEIPEDEE
jgi:hypothetical protein